MRRDAPFVGRVDQMALLSGRLAEAREGDARTVLIGGEAGVGKSRLLSRFAHVARESGAHVLIGSCEEHFGDPMPYGPLLEMLDGFRREHGEDRAASLGGPAYRRLEAFFDLAADAVAAPQQVVFLAVRRMLDDIGADQPVVVIVEDLHWADPSTLDLVRHLGQARPEGRRLLLVCTLRSREVGLADPLGQLLAGGEFQRRTERVELPPFDQEELRQFLTAAAGADVDPELVERCRRWTDGIPFYAEQLMAAGALEDTEDVRLPADTSSVILARLSGLSRDALRVLRVAAVAGRAMSRQLLREVSGLHPADLHEAVQECFDRQMLVAGQEVDVYRFRHALLREAVYQSTVRDARVDLHIAMAEALAADARLSLAPGSATAEQASHWYQAGVAPKALAFAVRAGEAAMHTLAFASAETQFTRALQLWPQVDEPAEQAGTPQARLLMSAADAARWSGHVDRALDYVRQAIGGVTAEADPGLAGELHERLGNYLWEAGRRADSGAAFREAAWLLEGRPASAVKARVLAGIALAHLQAGHYAEGGFTADQALAMAREVGARAEEGRALNVSGLALGIQGHRAEGEARLREAVAIARSVNHIEDLLRAYANLGLILEHAGMLRESAAETMAGLEEARRFDLAGTRQGTVLANNASAALILLGEWDDAERIITEVSLRRPPAESLYPRLTLAEIMVARGDFDEARGLLATIEGVELGEDPRFLGPLHAVRAELALGTGKRAEAAAEVGRGIEAVRAGENTLELLRLCALGLRCAADQAETGELEPPAAAAAGDRYALLGWEAGAESANPEVRQLVRACRAERLRIRRADTAETWKEVAAGWAELDRPYPATYARWRQAVTAARDGRRDDAREPAREAYLSARTLGAVPLRDAVARLAARIRLKLTDPPVRAERPYGLSAAEFETLRFLTEGYDAARIASARGVVRRTAETQLSSVYRKLGVHSAVEAVALANRKGLLR